MVPSHMMQPSTVHLQSLANTKRPWRPNGDTYIALASAMVSIVLGALQVWASWPTNAAER
ncbi:hypothetical protein SNOG_02804 [Parastagonospora nodorum SN15]|uniref:Uncharacterized protein n=1 Tax=Phaeosphaeria nodorum (strain SN15 / ATCC MYA-4574 / FGSC 10173) TaxID=321614 RepID=Q0UZL0_PHANO|nr:hypothetical protein SNOG_02804 [Parastagonospora nodorum SN15]EAT89535.1 hypothetical protein SNOG_02804 [Parastagonospora nodorum SN15]